MNVVSACAIPVESYETSHGWYLPEQSDTKVRLNDISQFVQNIIYGCFTKVRNNLIRLSVLYMNAGNTSGHEHNVFRRIQLKEPHIILVGISTTATP